MRLRGLRAGGRMHPAKRPLRPESVRPGRRSQRGRAGGRRRGHRQRPTLAGRGRGEARRRGGTRFLRMNRRVARRRVYRAVPASAKGRERGRTAVAPGSGPVRTEAGAVRRGRSRARGNGPRTLGRRRRLGTGGDAGRSIPGGARGRPGRALAAGPGRDPRRGRIGRMLPPEVRPETPTPTVFRNASPPPGWVRGGPSTSGSRRAGSG